MPNYKQIWHGIKSTKWLIKFNIIERDAENGYKERQRATSNVGEREKKN